MRTRSTNKDAPKEKESLPKKLSDRKIEKLKEAKRVSQEFIEAKRASQEVIVKTVGDSFLSYLQTVEKKFPGVLIYLCTSNDSDEEKEKWKAIEVKIPLFSAPQGRLFMGLQVNKKTSLRKTSQKTEHKPLQKISSEKSDTSTSEGSRKPRITDVEINQAINKHQTLLYDLHAYLLTIPTHYTFEILSKLLAYRRSFVNGIMPENWLNQISDRLNTDYLSKAERDPKSEEPPTPEQLAAQRLRDKLNNYICGCILFKLVSQIPTEILSIPMRAFAIHIWNNPDNNASVIIRNQLEALARQIENNFNYVNLVTYITTKNTNNIAVALESYKLSLTTFHPNTHRDLAALREQGMNVFLSHWYNIITNEILRGDKNTHKQLKKMIVSYLKEHMEVIVKFRNSVLLTIQILEACENSEKTSLAPSYKLFKRKIRRHHRQQTAEAHAQQKIIKLAELDIEQTDALALQNLQDLVASLPDLDDLALSLTPEQETLTASTLTPSSSTYSKTLVERTLSLNDLSQRGSTGSESETSSNRSGSSSYNPRTIARRLTQMSLKRGAKNEKAPSQEALQSHELMYARRKEIVASESRETSPPVARRNPRPVRKKEIPEDYPVINTSREIVQIPGTLFTPAPAPTPSPDPEIASSVIYSKKRK